MSSSIVKTYRTEAGVNSNPSVFATVNTHCNNGTQNLKKHFHEVYIYWDGVSAWVESPVWNPLLLNITVALKVENECTGDYSYIDMTYNNFRYLGLCCLNCPNPLPVATLPDATLNVVYNTTLQLLGNGPFAISIISKPAWMTITVNATTGLVTISGTPDDPGPVNIQLQASNCGNGIIAPTSTYALQVNQVLLFTDRAAPAGAQWSDVAYGAGLFVAIMQTGVGQRVSTSPDGITWTLRNSASDSTWNAICFSPSLGLFVAVAQTGVMTSPDGINWTSQTEADLGQWRDVIWVEELLLFVAVGSLGTNRVMTSPDGVVWTAQVASTLNQWYGVAWSADLNLLVAVGITGAGNRVMTSPDGVTWTTGVTPADNNWRKAVWSSRLQLFVAVANTMPAFTSNCIMTSPDGITWTLRSSANQSPLNNIAEVDHLLIAVGGTGIDPGKMVKSVDGITWAVASSINHDWSGIAWDGSDTIVVTGPAPNVATAPWIAE